MLQRAERGRRRQKTRTTTAAAATRVENAMLAEAVTNPALKRSGARTWRALLLKSRALLSTSP
jgi:hypothetical protein